MYMSNDDCMEIHLATNPIKEIYVWRKFGVGFFPKSVLSAWNLWFHNYRDYFLVYNFHQKKLIEHQISLRNWHDFYILCIIVYVYKYLIGWCSMLLWFMCMLVKLLDRKNGKRKGIWIISKIIINISIW